MKIIYNDRQITLAEFSNLPPEPMETTMPNDPDIKVTHLRFRDFRGISALDLDIPPSGVVFSGTNAAGKTSALMGLRAAFEAIGIGPDAIRFDADKFELVVDTNRFQVRRVTTRKSTSSEMLGSDGVPIPRAKEQMRQMLGEDSLDPLKLYLSDAKDRRKLILSACPVQITVEDLNGWCETQQEWNTDGHGQEVLSRVRQMFFDKRTNAGRTVDQAKAVMEVKQRDADAIRVTEKVDPPEVVRTHVAAIERDLAVLSERKRAALEQEEALASTKVRITEIRTAIETRILSQERKPTSDEVAEVDARVNAAAKRFEEATRELEEARKAQASLDDRLKIAEDQQKDIDSLMSQAKDLEASVVNVQSEWNPEFHAHVVADKEKDLEQAKANVQMAEKAQRHKAAQAEVEEAERTYREAESAWAKLDRIVKRLTEEAPAVLAKRSNQIPGLEVTPTAILLDGKNIDLLSGAERMRLAVEVAKRAARKAKILTIDGLEQLAPSNQPEFVRMCLEGGYQLFATRVADGALDIVDCYQLAHKE